MNAWELPRSLNVGGREYAIRTDFRAVLDILAACNDPDLDRDEQMEIMLTILYPDFADMPREHIPDAVERACEFIDCGQKRDGRKRPRLVDWEQDAPVIIPAVNTVAGCEIRAAGMHWWTFCGYYMSIGESLFSSVLRIRLKKAKGEKLEKQEEAFYRENRELVELKKRLSAEDQEAVDKFMAWLDS